MADDNLLSRITVDPNLCHGKPCVRGLRYPVEFLLELLSGGMTIEQILSDYPDLEADDFRAVFAYGARLSQVQRMDAAVVAGNSWFTRSCRAAWRVKWRRSAMM
jgi:uncharacterized protein (DUF433 family)